MVKALYCFKVSKDYRSFVDTIEDMGPVFVKLAQSMSIRADIIDENFAQEILRICDRMRAPCFDDIKCIIESEFKLPIEAIFSSIEKQSIACASVAAVYKARTIEGTEVAVKVLRPNIEKIFARDVKILFFIANLVNAITKKRNKLLKIIERFATSSKFELDLRFEAANAATLKKNLENDINVYVPKVFWKRTTKRVLTMEYITGISFTQLKEYNDNVARNLIISFFKQVYRDGFFHADLHPGNLLLVGDKITFVDFGIMGRITDDHKRYVLEVVNALLNRDYEALAEAHFKRNYVSRDQLHFITACRAIGEPILEKSLNEIFISELLGQILKVIADFNVEVNIELLLLKKNLLFVEGNCLRLSPDINMWEAIAPFIHAWYKDNYKAKNIIGLKMQQFSQLIKLIESNIKKESLIKDNELRNDFGNKHWWIKAIVVINLCISIFTMLKLVS